MSRLIFISAIIACAVAAGSTDPPPRVLKLGESASSFVDFAVMQMYQINFSPVDHNNGHTINLDYTRGRADLYWRCGSLPTLSSSKIEGGVHKGISWYRFTRICSSSTLYIGVYGYTAVSYKLGSTYRSTLDTRPGAVVSTKIERPESLYYRFSIPTNIALVQFPFEVTEASKGWKVSFRVRKDYIPTSSSYNWKKESSLGEECIESSNPAGGEYYIQLLRYSGPSTGEMALKFQIILNGLDGCTFGFNHHPMHQAYAIAAEPLSNDEVALLLEQA